MIAPSNKSESKLQSEILKYLSRLEQSYFFKTIVCNKAGVPDIVGVYKGKPIYIEVKSLKGVMSELQLLTREKLLKAKAIHIVARELDDVKALIEDLNVVNSIKETYED